MKALKLTPNLVVRDVTDSLNFYRDVLGFERAFSVPDAPPYVFAACGGGGVETFLMTKMSLEKITQRSRRILAAASQCSLKWTI